MLPICLSPNLMGFRDRDGLPRDAILKNWIEMSLPQTSNWTFRFLLQSRGAPLIDVQRLATPQSRQNTERAFL